MLERSTTPFILINAENYMKRWVKQLPVINSHIDEIKKYYKSIEDQIGANTAEAKQAHWNAVERVLKMTPEEVYDLYSTDEKSLKVTGIEFAEISEWPKCIVREIIGFCKEWQPEN